MNQLVGSLISALVSSASFFAIVQTVRHPLFNRAISPEQVRTNIVISSLYIILALTIANLFPECYLVGFMLVLVFQFPIIEISHPLIMRHAYIIELVYWSTLLPAVYIAINKI